MTASGSWVVALDNLSTIHGWLSDAICRAATGGGTSRRQLYTDDGLTVFNFRRAVIITGIDVGGLRGDLADRMVPIQLKRLVKVEPESKLSAAWEVQRGSIFGGLLDLAAEAHAMLPTVGDAVPLPRMADYGRALACVDAIMGTDGMARYLAHRRRELASSATSDPFIEQLFESPYSTGENAKTAAQILIDVALYRRSGPTPLKDWPESTRNVTTRLRHNAPAMRSMGWTVDDDGGQNKDGIVRWTIEPPAEIC